jgi:hypothetical protein
MLPCPHLAIAASPQRPTGTTVVCSGFWFLWCATMLERYTQDGIKCLGVIGINIPMGTVLGHYRLHRTHRVNGRHLFPAWFGFTHTVFIMPGLNRQ